MGLVFMDLMELHRTYTTDTKEYANKFDAQRALLSKVSLDDESYRLGAPRPSGTTPTVDPTDFWADMLVNNGFISVRITSDFAGRRFSDYATPFERGLSVLCNWKHNPRKQARVNSGERGLWFRPIVVFRAEYYVQVVGHTGIISGNNLLTPSFEDRGATPMGAFEKGAPVYVSPTPALPEGWHRLGADDLTYRVVTKPDGEVTNLLKVGERSVEGANWVIDLVVAPATLALAKSGARALSLMARAPVRPAPKVLAGPTKEVAKEFELSAARTTMRGMAVTTRGVGALPVKQVGRRTYVLGHDMAKFETAMAQAPTEAGFFDVVIHGNKTSFIVKEMVNGAEVKRVVSARELADIIRPLLKPGEQVRLLACRAAETGAPARQLANELGRTVWAPDNLLHGPGNLFISGQHVFGPAKDGTKRAKFFAFEAGQGNPGAPLTVHPPSGHRPL